MRLGDLHRLHLGDLEEARRCYEAVLLEMLAEFQVSVPEVGTFVAKQPPYVILTSNNTRDLSAALATGIRSCLTTVVDVVWKVARVLLSTVKNVLARWITKRGDASPLAWPPVGSAVTVKLRLARYRSSRGSASSATPPFYPSAP